MSILLSDNFSYQGRKPLDSRLVYETIADMVAMSESTIYPGIIAYVKDNNTYYTFDPDNTSDATLGKWVEFKTNSLDAGNANIYEYEQGKDYKIFDLIFYDGFLYLSMDDFTSDDTEATLDESFNKDTITLSHLIPVTTHPDWYMPQAPLKYQIKEITNAGTGYAVNDIIANVDLPPTKGSTTNTCSVKVLTVGTNGEVLTAEILEEKLPAAGVGTGAKFETDFVYQVGAGSKWYDFPQIELDANAKLLETITSNVEVGGAPAGTVFNKDMEFTEVMKKILRKVINPLVTFTASNSGVHEIGTSVGSSFLKLVISNLNDVTVPINTIEFKKNGTVIDTQNFVAGIDTYSFTVSDPITENTTFSATLTYDTSKTLDKTQQFKFVKASYAGSVNTLTPTADDIVALGKVVKDTKSYIWNNITLNDARYCYAYPNSFGDLTSIKDANNFEYLGSYTKTTMMIDSTLYNIYVLTDPVTITGAKQVYA